jgi:hypothetical protein
LKPLAQRASSASVEAKAINCPVGFFTAYAYFHSPPGNTNHRELLDKTRELTENITIVEVRFLNPIV